MIAKAIPETQKLTGCQLFVDWLRILPSPYGLDGYLRFIAQYPGFEDVIYADYLRSKIEHFTYFVINRQPITAERFKLTPQEELFAQFFNNERGMVATLDDLSLIAHREELAKIAFEARARLTAADDEIRGRKSKKSAKGLITSLEPDSTASDAITNIKKRQGKLTKVDKAIESMMKAGIDRATAEQLVSAGTIKANLDAKFGVRPEQDAKPPFNPFAKHPNPIDDVAPAEVTIQEETNTIIIHEAPKVEEPKKPFNPFAK